MSDWESAAFSAARAAAAEPSEAGRTRQARWDRDHMRTASCRLTVAEMNRLRAITDRAGISVYSLIRYMLLAFMFHSGG